MHQTIEINFLQFSYHIWLSIYFISSFNTSVGICPLVFLLETSQNISFENWSWIHSLTSLHYIYGFMNGNQESTLKVFNGFLRIQGRFNRNISNRFRWQCNRSINYIFENTFIHLSSVILDHYSSIHKNSNSIDSTRYASVKTYQTMHGLIMIAIPHIRIDIGIPTRIVCQSKNESNDIHYCRL